MNIENDTNTTGSISIPENEIQDDYLYSTSYTC